MSRYPDNVVERICLRCNKPFPSLSPVNRVCHSCRAKNESIHPRAEGLNRYKEAENDDD